MLFNSSTIHWTLYFSPSRPRFHSWQKLPWLRSIEWQETKRAPIKNLNCNLRPVLSFWWSTGSENLLRRSRHTAEIKASYQLFNPMVCGVFTVGRSISTAPQASLWLPLGAQRHAPFIYSKSNYSGPLGNHSKMFKTKWLVLWIKTCPIHHYYCSESRVRDLSSSIHPACIYLSKNIPKSVMLWNIITI